MPGCGDSQDMKHCFMPREVVDENIKKTYKFSCTSCKDAKLYGGKRPFMKTQATGNHCRNTKDMCPKSHGEKKVVKTPKSITKDKKAPRKIKTHIRELEMEIEKIRKQSGLTIHENSLALLKEWEAAYEEEEGEEDAEQVES